MTSKAKNWLMTSLLIAVALTTTTPAEASSGDERYLVGFHAMPSLQPGDTYHGGLVTHVNDNLRYATVLTDDPTTLTIGTMLDSNVRYLEEDLLKRLISLTPNDPQYASQYGPQQIQAPAAWDDTLGGTGSICIADTGVRYTHEDLSAKYLGGHDFINNDNDPWDDQGHGTHVAGSAAATINNAKGIAGVSNAGHYAVKVLNHIGEGTFQSVADGIEWCTDNTPPNTVISMSLSGSGGAQVLQDAVQYAENNGKLVVAAAGNSGGGAVGYPAAYSEVVAVTCTDSLRSLCSFSSVGPQAELAAPGHNILSTCFTGNTGYCTKSGTSMSTPHVSGVAALVWSFNSDLTNQELRECLQDSARDLGLPGRDSAFGFGEVRADAALLECPPFADVTPPNAPSVSSTTHPDPTEFYHSANFKASWSAQDDPDGSGIDGYSYDVVNAGTSTALNCIKNVEEWTTSQTFSVPSFSEKVLRIRAIDNAGNCGPITTYAANTDRVDPYWTQISPTGTTDNPEEPIVVKYTDDDLGADPFQTTKVDANSVRMWVDGVEVIPTTRNSNQATYDPGFWLPGEHTVRVEFSDEAIGSKTVAVEWEFTVGADTEDVDALVDTVFRVVNQCMDDSHPTCETVWQCLETPPSGGVCQTVVEIAQDCVNGNEPACQTVWDCLDGGAPCSTVQDCLDGTTAVCQTVWDCADPNPSGLCGTVRRIIDDCLDGKSPCDTVQECLDGNSAVCQPVWDCVDGGSPCDTVQTCLGGGSPCDTVQECLDGNGAVVCQTVRDCIDGLPGSCGPVDIMECVEGGPPCDTVQIDQLPCEEHPLLLMASSSSDEKPGCHEWVCYEARELGIGLAETLLLCPQDN